MAGEFSDAQIQIQSSPIFKLKSKFHLLKKLKSIYHLLKNFQIQVREFKSKSTNPDLKIRWAPANFKLHCINNSNITLEEVDLWIWNLQIQIQQSSNPNPPLWKKLKSKSTISKKCKSNPNPPDLAKAKVGKSAFKSKSGFGFARQWLP